MEIGQETHQETHASKLVEDTGATNPGQQGEQELHGVMTAGFVLDIKRKPSHSPFAVNLVPALPGLSSKYLPSAHSVQLTSKAVNSPSSSTSRVLAPIPRSCHADAYP